MNGKQRTGQDGLSRREVLVGLGAVTAGLPVAPLATAARAQSQSPAGARSSGAAEAGRGLCMEHPTHIQPIPRLETPDRATT